MAVTVLDNQLFKLQGSEDFNTKNQRCTWDNRTYCQPVNVGQVTQFQVKVSPATGVNLITNGGFSDGLNDWTTTGAWGVTGSGEQYALSATIGATIEQSVTLTAGKTYRLSYEIITIDTASFPNSALTLFITGAGTVTSLGSTGDSTAVGALTDDFTVDTTGSYTIKFQSFLCYNLGFDNVVLYEMSDPTFSLQTEAGVWVQDITDVSKDIDTITVRHLWTGLTEGNYKICIDNVDDLALNYMEGGLQLETERGVSLTTEVLNEILIIYG